MKKLITVAALALVTSLGIVCVKADNFAYMGVRGGGFGTIDLNTGVFSLLGNSGQQLAGLAVQNGTLYGSSWNTANGTLYSVNPANGNLTAIGSSAVTYDDLGSTTSGIFAVGTNANLYSINSANGAATLIGPTGLNVGNTVTGNTIGLSTAASVLYFTDVTNLYSLNTTSGAATLIGNMGSDQVAAMVFEGNSLYAGENSPSLQVDTLNSVTGAVTGGPSVTGTGNTFWGLAPDTVPEPSAISLLAIGGLACVFRRRRA